AHSSIVANGYVYVIGGSISGVSYQSTVFYAKLNSDGSTSAWATNANALPEIRGLHSSIIANGYVYVIGGYSNSFQSTIYYAKLNSDGSTGTWSTNTNALPGSRAQHSSIVANGYVYVIGGTANGSVYQSTVYYAKLNSDGSTGAWSTNANALLGIRGRLSSIVANGYVYVIGGIDGSANQSTVFYASTARVLISGNLDLIGLASTTVSDSGGDNGSTGGSIFAGNIFSQNRLEVGGNTQLFGGLSVNGLLSLTASSSGQQNVPIFSIQNATGTLPLFSLAYNGGLGIGTTSPNSGVTIIGGNVGIGTTTYSSMLSVQGNGFFSGNLAAAIITATGSIGVGTSSPASEIAATGNGTTTVYLNTGTNIGGCIQLKSASGTVYRLYIGAGDTATTSGVGSGSGRQSGILAIWEIGSCK
ncbi:MAG: hypothetical protein Q7S73_02415, partial [bacterium]|nr:hypothetical protein [bacterium]